MKNYNDYPTINDDEPEEQRWIEAEPDETDLSLDIFDDPDPYDTFHLQFHVLENGINYETYKTFSSTTKNVNKNYENNKKCKNTINVTLKGMKTENCQTISSTGLTLWNASTLLCEFVCSNVGIIKQKDILEVGSGLGLCGIVAYKMGARRVIMTEGDTDVLVQMRKNVNLNIYNICQSPYQLECEEELIPSCLNILPCRQLKWGSCEINEFRKKWCCAKTKEMGTGVYTCANDRFDVIMGSDIIYADDIIEPLFDTVTGLLSYSIHALFLLAYIRRNVKIELVLDCAKRRGFHYEKADHTMDDGVYMFHWKEIYN